MDSDWSDSLELQTGTGAIDKLPKEILQKVFQFILTKAVLHSCRFVSRTWNSIATYTCRKRYVKLKDFTYYVEKPKHRLQDVFIRDTEVPWSAVDLVFDNGHDNAHNNARWMSSKKICEAYGTQIRSLHAKVCSMSNFIQALRFVPNMETLRIEPSINDSEDDNLLTVQSFRGIRLSKLKHLIFYNTCNLDDQVVALLEFVQERTGASITSLKLGFIHQVSSDAFQKLVHLLYRANIPKITLDIVYEENMIDSLESVEYKQSIGIHDLGVHFALSLSYIEKGDTYYQLERFLANCTRLQTLRLVDTVMRIPPPMSPSKRLRIPTFQDLETIQISLDWYFFPDDDAYNYNNCDTEYQLLGFNMLKATDLPNLKTVSLSLIGWAEFLKIDTGKIYIGKIFDTCGTPFKSVKILNIQIGFRNVAVRLEFIGKFATIFPNIVKMTTIIDIKNQIEAILDRMDNLKELDLTLQSATDNNELLFHSLGFIRRCKELKKLTLRNEDLGWKDSGKALEGIGLILLTQLHPLNLEIFKAQVKETDNCVTLLRMVHPEVRFLQSIGTKSQEH